MRKAANSMTNVLLVYGGCHGKAARVESCQCRIDVKRKYRDQQTHPMLLFRTRATLVVIDRNRWSSSPECAAALTPTIGGLLWLDSARRLNQPATERVAVQGGKIHSSLTT
jgi:hypothetical protein